MQKITDDKRSTKEAIFDVFLLPLRGVIQPIFDGYRKRETRTKTMNVPAWAVSDIKNTPVPYTVEHQYDFGMGGVYGPPDMPVTAGTVNVEKQIKTQHVSDGRHKFGLHRASKENTGFNHDDSEEGNVEVFVYSPFVLPTDLPCSTVMTKY
jgi:hypothetical protein